MSFAILDTYTIEVFQDKSVRISKGCDLFIDFSKFSIFTVSPCDCKDYVRLNIDNKSYFVRGTQLLKNIEFI